MFLSARRLLRGTNRPRDVVTKDTGVGGVCARCPALRRRWPTSSPPPPPVSQDGAASPSCTSSEWPVCGTAETLRFRNTVSRGFQGTASPWPIAMIRLIKRKNHKLRHSTPSTSVVRGSHPCPSPTGAPARSSAEPHERPAGRRRARRLHPCAQTPRFLPPHRLALSQLRGGPRVAGALGVSRVRLGQRSRGGVRL